VRPWREAWDDALYGDGGFFVREAPADHFATSVTASPLLAEAVRALAHRVDDALGRPDPFDVVDLGAGRGELLQALPDVPARWRLTAVERAPSPGLPGVRWVRDVPRTTGLLLAHEWLDAVPLDVLEDGRLVLVAPDGRESSGPVAPDGLRAWAARWWPGGGRVEVGLARDRAWAAAVRQVERGLALAVDYGHALGDARFGPRRPTLTGYRAGRAVPPVPDGSCDVTAHVALDACAAATGARLLDQRAALRALGVDGRVPPEVTAAGLQRAAAAARLLDPAGAGGFGWLVQPVRVPDPFVR
jgi:SAM-dependent MidA family methyltransferase